MHNVLWNKKVIFFDVGYTLDYPLSGDWMFTRKFYELAGEALAASSPDAVERARDRALSYLERHHLVLTEDEEYRQFIRYYSFVSEELDLGLTDAAIGEIALDRTYNMKNYVAYPDAERVVKTLGEAYKLGIISDTWPSIHRQLRAIGVADYFSTRTFSFALGTFKPDGRMYRDALEKGGFPAEDTVFVDDSARNLEGAARLGMTPVLIARTPVPDAASPFITIRSLSELIEDPA